MKAIYIIPASLFLFFSLGTAFGQGIFLELTPATTGGTQPPATPGEYPLTSVQYAISNPPVTLTTGGSTGTTTTGIIPGRTSFAPVTLTKQVNASSPSLQFQLTRGGFYSRVRLNFYDTTGKLVYRIALGTALVTEYNVSGAEACANGCPGLSETITLSYREIAIIDYAQTPVQPVTWSLNQSRPEVDPALTQN